MLFSAQEYKPKGNLGLVARWQRDDVGGEPDFVGTPTSVRLGVDLGQNQLVNVAVRAGFEIICCKSHEICVFSKMKTERICRHVWREASRWSFFLMMAIRTSAMR